MSEGSLLKQIQVALSNAGARLFRNNVGRYKNSSGHWIQYGLAVGSSDLVGWRSIKVTQEMVGQTVAIFAACEVKTKAGRLTQDQNNFLEVVKQSGGIACVARSVDEAIEGICGTPRED